MNSALAPTTRRSGPLLASGPKAPKERRLTSVPHLTPAIHAPRPGRTSCPARRLARRLLTEIMIRARLLTGWVPR